MALKGKKNTSGKKKNIGKIAIITLIAMAFISVVTTPDSRKDNENDATSANTIDTELAIAPEPTVKPTTSSAATLALSSTPIPTLALTPEPTLAPTPEPIPVPTPEPVLVPTPEPSLEVIPEPVVPIVDPGNTSAITYVLNTGTKNTYFEL